MSLLSVKKEFTTGITSKKEYIEEMYSIHKTLFEYSDLLKSSPVTKIEILGEKIILSIRSTTGNSLVKIICTPDDSRTTALEILNFGEYESGDSKILYEFIKSDSIVFDIGANIGWYSINFSEVLKNGKVYAFEPIPLIML